MNAFRLIVGTLLVGSWTLLVFSGHASAQVTADATVSETSSSQAKWKRRVLRREQPAQVSYQTAQPWSPNRPNSLSDPTENVSAIFEFDPAADEAGPLLSETSYISQGEPLASLPSEGDSYFALEAQGPCSQDCGQDCGQPCGPGSSSCGSCPGDCWQEYGYCMAVWDQFVARWLRNVNLFAGVHGFKGSFDQGGNGNFGFHEGLSWGAPLGGPHGLGYQVGIQAVHSNFSGDQVNGFRRGDRDQIFLTSGIFHRALCGGLQWGVVFDYLHDSYYNLAEVAQIRAEISLVRPDQREIGFWGAFGVNDDNGILLGPTVLENPLEPIDVYSFFYRRYFSGGGQGRIWTGVTNQGDVVIGSDFTVPLGTSWALENNFLYMIPDEGRGTGAQQRETWSVAMQLVWYPGRQARSVRKSPYFPLFGVADNTWFLVDRN